jgi:hypothetical protein
MKVYIKPWKEASECAKEANTLLVDTSDDGTRILSILSVTQQAGDWGHITEATKDGKYYTAEGRYSFIYPACCVEEITPEWLEQNADKFKEEIISNGYDTSVIIIYKVIDALNTYFFYVKRVSYNGCEETVEDFREIKQRNKGDIDL